jgi:hypothetical protein
MGFGPADAGTSYASAASWCILVQLVTVLAGARLTASLLRPPFTTKVPYLAGSPTSCFTSVAMNFSPSSSQLCRSAEVRPGFRDQTRKAKMQAVLLHDVDADNAAQDLVKQGPAAPIHDVDADLPRINIQQRQFMM